MKKMDCIILAAGRGTRMGKLTVHCPKPMLEIAGRPKLAWNIESLPEDIDRVIIVTGYLGKHIKNYFGDNFNGREILYVEQNNLNGTDGAVRLCKEIIKLPVMVINGDDFYKKQDLEKLITYDNATLCYETNGSEKLGLISTNSAGRFSKINDKSSIGIAGLVYVGASMLHSEYFETDSVYFRETESGIPHTQITMNNPPLVITTKLWQPVGNPEQLDMAKKRIQEFI